MFKVGDFVVYSVHGLCKINDICEKTIIDETKMYYVLQPLEQPSLTISTPVDNHNGLILEIMSKKEAKEILQSFAKPGAAWIKEVRKRMSKYNEMVKSGNRQEIAAILNTLMRKNIEAARNKKKLYDQDRKLMERVQSLLFKELAMVLDTSMEEITKQVEKLLMRQMKASEKQKIVQ